MKKSLQLFVFLFLLANYSSFSTTYYVAITGNDANNGTSKATAVLNLSVAVTKAIAGDIISIGSGTYTVSTTINLTIAATEANPITIIAENLLDRPLFDFSTQAFGKRGISLTGSYWKVKGIIVKGSGDNGLFIGGSNNVVEYCSFFDNRDSGLQLSSGAANNKIINCDSYYNADPTDYGDADGFACKMDVGSGNYFYGCRAWLNVDDGWDGYLRGADNVTTILENCWTWRNGYFKDGKDGGANANGNGFKMGGSDDKLAQHNFILRNCLSFENKSKGFDQNNNKGSMTLYNCTGYNNVSNNYSVYIALATGKQLILTNCVELGNKRSLLTTGIYTTNSWQTPFITTSADFISITPENVTAPRKADGSLPDITFMHLAPSSDLIAAGTDCGILFSGLKPDLGAFPFSILSSIKNKTDKKFGLNCIPSVFENQFSIFINNDFQNSERMNIQIYDINGRKFKTIPNQQAQSGLTEISINAGGFPSGIYLCVLEINGQASCQKIIKR